MRISDAELEYRQFLHDYLLPLMGLPIKDLEELKPINEARDSSFHVQQKKDAGQGKSTLTFKINELPYFDFDTNMIVPEKINRIARNVITSFAKVSKYDLSKKANKTNCKYLSDILRVKSYEYAVQHGICTWIKGTTSCDAIEKLLKILERWSVQTYEGRKVPFGFIVNPNEKGTFDWLEFLEDDYSATLTDCINSLIELDTDGKLIKYHSLPETFLGRDEGIGARPYRFVDVLINYVSMGRIGIFLLSNGDIILSDDTKIRFVKRNLKWLNMSYEAFESVLRDVNLSPPLTLKMINELYASILDVSFAHTGGIISIVSDIQSLVNKNSRNSILSPSDNLANPRDDSLVLTKKLKYQKIGDKEVKKRLLKREAIVSLIGNDNFYGLARKLRAELIAMDGACIINPEGEIYSIGAIIRNKGGSSGGGRSAACKQLSEFGIAIKISTDGYIEVFKGGEAVYTVK